MRTFLKIILVFALSIFSSGNLFAYTIDDLTDVGKGRTDDIGDNHRDMTDVLGANGYNTYGIDVGFSGYVMTLDFFTRFDGIDLVGGVSIELADIFFDSGSGDYDYAVDMGDNKIYSDVTSYTTSEDKFQGISGGPWNYE